MAWQCCCADDDDDFIDDSFTGRCSLLANACDIVNLDMFNGANDVATTCSLQQLCDAAAAAVVVIFVVVVSFEF